VFGAYMDLINIPVELAISIELAAFVIAYFINKNN